MWTMIHRSIDLNVPELPDSACRVWATSARQVLCNQHDCAWAAGQKEACVGALSKETFHAFLDEHSSFFGCCVHVSALVHSEHRSGALQI